ncbi:MAG: SbcC/MukB-like Walker B domain-containing protein, partial [Egibacteraceae bacterium]
AAERAEAALAAAQGSERLVIDAGATSERLRSEAAALAVPADALGLGVQDAALLSRLAQIVAACAALLGDFEAETDMLRAAAQAAGEEAASARARAQAAVDAAARAASAVREGLAQVRDKLARLPEMFRPDLAIPADAEGVPWPVDLTVLGRAVEAVEARKAVLRQREGERAALQSQLDGLDAEGRELDRAFRRDVDGARQALCARLDDCRERMARHIDQLGLPVALPPRSAGAPIEELADVAGSLTDACARSLKTLHERIAHEREREQAARESLAESGIGAETLCAPEPLAQLTRDYEQAAYQARQERERAAALEAALPRIELLDELGAGLAERRGALTDLSAALKPGAFPKWLTLRRSKALLAVASTLLGDITRDRYGFADIDAEDAEWLILDRDTGQARSPSTLSGGEKFVASLALALGMVELMARSGGRLESLFLDEGFGALDRANLDAAIEALAAVALKGRMVAVISHVRAVAEQVDDVLSVTRHPTGSRATWLTPTQRRALVSDDLLDDATSAISGLLD